MHKWHLLTINRNKVMGVVCTMGMGDLCTQAAVDIINGIYVVVYMSV